MGRVPHFWREAYDLALRESDPRKLIGCIEYAIFAIERRYSEWGNDPGTPAELAAIRKCISALKRLMKEKQPGNGHAAAASVASTTATERDAPKDHEQATGLLLVLPSNLRTRTEPPL